MRMLVCVPSIVVVRVGSELIMSPLRLHVMDNGLSPLVMTQVSWTKSPWLTALLPKEKGTMTGFSVNKIYPVTIQKITIDFNLSWVCGYSSWVLCSTGVNTTVVVVHRWYDQHASLCTKHGGGQGGVRWHNVSLQTPGYCQRSVSFGDHTGELYKLSLVNSISPNREGDNDRLLCK